MTMEGETGYVEIQRTRDKEDHGDVNFPLTVESLLNVEERDDGICTDVVSDFSGPSSLCHDPECAPVPASDSDDGNLLLHPTDLVIILQGRDNSPDRNDFLRNIEASPWGRLETLSIPGQEDESTGETTDSSAVQEVLREILAGTKWETLEEDVPDPLETTQDNEQRAKRRASFPVEESPPPKKHRSEEDEC